MTKGLLSSEDIVRDVEFELLLGTIPQENVENAILSIKSHHNRLWSELSESVRDARLREAFNKVFQFQEMLLVLLQEMSALIGSLQASLPEIVDFAKRPGFMGLEEALPVAATQTGSDKFFPYPSIDLVEITKLMEPEFLRLDLEVRPSRLPFVGRLIRSIKIALHHLVLFYVNRLGVQQAQVNRVYGERIMELIRIVQEQQAQIRVMAALIDQLRSLVQEKA